MKKGYTNKQGLNEIIENVILHFGNKLESDGYGASIHLDTKDIAEQIQCERPDDVQYVVEYLHDYNFIDDKQGQMGSGRLIGLSYRGWEYYRQLKLGQSSGENGFMAMKFCPESEEYFKKYIRPAVQAAGFDIRRITDNAKAGNIDNQMRDEIRLSKFVIADLTHDNNGAYWEAGFAEGIGKPVIYLCEKTKFEDPNSGTHFDTNHHTTIKLDFDDWKNAKKILTATLRNTFPDESYGS